MNREELVNEIFDFLIEYFEQSVNEDEMKKGIAKRLEDSDFIENLINTIIVRTRNRDNIDVEGIIDLLSQLDILRLHLEYRR